MGPPWWSGAPQDCWPEPSPVPTELLPSSLHCLTCFFAPSLALPPAGGVSRSCQGVCAEHGYGPPALSTVPGTELGCLVAELIGTSSRRGGSRGRGAQSKWAKVVLPYLWTGGNEVIHLGMPCFRRGSLSYFSRVLLFGTLWTVALQAPLSMGFPRQKYWSGLPFPPPGDLPDPGIKHGSPALQADSSLSEPPWEDRFKASSLVNYPHDFWKIFHPLHPSIHPIIHLFSQKLTLHADITRWPIPKSDWLYSLQLKMEKLYIVSKNKTGADCGSDRELLIAKFRLKLKKVGKPLSHSSIISGSDK